MAFPDGPLQVLLVEDDPGDALMTCEAFEGRGRLLTVVNDGEQALAYIRREGEFHAVARPDLVVLDLNLPRRSGHEVLDNIKSDPDLRDIPVVVLTTSASPDDVLSSYRRHANAYVTKPVDWDSFVAAVRQIDDFFTEVASLPTHGA